MPVKNNVKKSDNLEDIKSDFITVASHQLRTPISAIRWSLDTLLSGRAGNLSDKQIEVAKEAYQSNKFMVKVVNDLLRVSRLEEKGIVLMPKFVSLEKIIKEIIERQDDFCKANNCGIKVIKELAIPKVYIDPLQIKPVINALIDNAIRYGKGKGKVEITLKKVKNYLLFKIKDHGIGVSENQKEMVFTKFFRGRNAMKSQTEGLGLNLYIAKKVIEASGGRINFKSIENKGTTFNVYLPISKKVPAKQSINNKKEGLDDILKKEREFVSITVHELKAPLGMTKWSLEILKSGKPGKLSQDQIDLIDQVYRGNERLLALVRDLLNLSELQEGKFEIEPKQIQFEEVISDVVNGFKVTAKKKNIRVVWKLPHKPLAKVIADPNRVAQVATNLISNAIKYTPENGNVTVKMNEISGKRLKAISDRLPTANLSFSNNPKGYLYISVQDSGIGISQEDQTKLFTRFFRSKNVLKTKAEGTGLGLYITKSIVNLHKGDIWFTSQLGKGSTFYFSLPIA